METEETLYEFYKRMQKIDSKKKAILKEFGFVNCFEKTKKEQKLFSRNSILINYLLNEDRRVFDIIFDLDLNYEVSKRAVQEKKLYYNKETKRIQSCINSKKFKHFLWDCAICGEEIKVNVGKKFSKNKLVCAKCREKNLHRVKVNQKTMAINMINFWHYTKKVMEYKQKMFFDIIKIKNNKNLNYITGQRNKS